MIVGNTTPPERQIYVLGARVLEALSKSSSTVVDVGKLLDEVRASEPMSENAFMLALNWLYVIGAVDGSDGQVKRCF